MSNRKAVPPQVETEILTRSRRRCCLCYFLRHDDSTKQGQIAHLDDDRDNNDPDNLCFLCLEHHDAYDSKTSQSKGFKIDEVKLHRNRLYEHIVRQDAAIEGVTTSPESVEKVIQRYEELLELRQRDIESLRAKAEWWAMTAAQIDIALADEEERHKQAQARLEAAKQEGDASEITSAMKVEAAIRRILLLEPHAETGESMAALFGRFGYELTPVRTRAEAEAALDSKSFDLLIAEVHEWKGDIKSPPPVELIRKARVLGMFVIVVSVLELDDRLDAVTAKPVIEAGVDAWFSKPTYIKGLVAAIQQLAQRKASGLTPQTAKLVTLPVAKGSSPAKDETAVGSLKLTSNGGTGEPETKRGFSAIWLVVAFALGAILASVVLKAG